MRIDRRRPCSSSTRLQFWSTTGNARSILWHSILLGMIGLTVLFYALTSLTHLLQKPSPLLAALHCLLQCIVFTSSPCASKKQLDTGFLAKSPGLGSPYKPTSSGSSPGSDWFVPWSSRASPLLHEHRYLLARSTREEEHPPVTMYWRAFQVPCLWQQEHPASDVRKQKHLKLQLFGKQSK